LLRLPVNAWKGLVRLLRDPQARLVAGLLIAVVAVILGLSWRDTVNTGFGFFDRGCAAEFSEGRLAILLMSTPIAMILALSTVGEAVRWMDARRRGHRHDLRHFWKLAVASAVLLSVAYFLGRC
jgi:hypothetical protein